MIAATTCSISVDLKPVIRQVYLFRMVADEASLPAEYANSLFLSYLDEMRDDLVFGNLATAGTTDGVVEFVQSFRLGAKFEDMISAIRTGKVL